MSRTLPATVSVAIAKDATRPAYLLTLGFSSDSPVGTTYAATWGQNITDSGTTYLASGIEVRNLSRTGCIVEFPIGESDTWLSMLSANGFRGRSISIREHYTDETQSPQAGSVLMFSGIFTGDAVITDKISITANEKSREITFPPESIGPPKFNFLMPSGTIIEWAREKTVVR